MSLPMGFGAVLRAFASPHAIHVHDTEGHYEHGVWRESEPVKRAKPLKAVVLTMKNDDLEIFREGEVALAGIAVCADQKLYFAEMGNDPEGRKVLQSYVDYQGKRYKVIGSGLMAGNSSLNIYHCVRYIV